MITGNERNDGTDNIIEVKVLFRLIVQEQEYFQEQEETKGRTLQTGVSWHESHHLTKLASTTQRYKYKSNLIS